MKLKHLFLALVFIVGLLETNGVTLTENGSLAISVKHIMGALEKAVMFYQNNRYDLNLDAYLGLRIAQGYIQELTGKKKSITFLMKCGALKVSQSLRRQISEITATTRDILLRTSPDYFNLVGSTVAHPWRTLKPYRRINHTLIIPLGTTKLSDDILQMYEQCLAEMLGSPVYGGIPCEIRPQCWRLVTRPGELGYVLTHQALYLLLGEQHGCLSKFSHFMKQDNISLQTVYDRICANIYPEMLLVERVQPIKRFDADLIMEQSVVCGLLGYYEFLTPRRLQNVLHWQKNCGCFGEIEMEERELDMERSERRTMRKLLMGKELEDGCESHITGVGTALLSIYLRYLVDGAPLVHTWKHHDNIQGGTFRY